MTGLKIFPYTPIDKQNILKAIYKLQQHEHKISNTRLPADEELCNSIFDELWRECIEQNGGILVAYQGDVFIGFVQYCFEESTNCYEIPEVRKYALISNICVMEEFRHLGFGQKLLNAAENAIRATGFIGKIQIWALANNKQACIAYQKNGFQKAEIVFEKPVILSENCNENQKLQTLTGNPALVHAGFYELPHNPLHLLQNWFRDAIKLNVSEPGGLVLSTVDSNGKPFSRVVLLKTIDDTGVIFASNSNSKKGMDISNNTSVAGTLWWRETMQQVNFMGHAAKMLPSISDDIWSGRTREAQAVAAISEQSAVMLDEELMRQRIKDLINSKTNIPRPETWCAYHINIQDIEFWLGSQDRFHHRVQYKLNHDVWRHQKLQP